MLLVALASLAGMLLIARLHRLVSDERWYALQVEWFLSGRYELIPITMLPGYHVVLAALLAPLGLFVDHAARGANLLVSLLLVPLALSLARRHGDPTPEMKAAQSLLQPLLFPFLFLVYTDAWSLVLLAALLLATLARRYWWAAAAGLAGTLVRQDFIAWVALAYALATLEGLDAWPGPRALSECIWKKAREAYPLLLVIAALLAFVAWNGAVTRGDQALHRPGINLTNVYVFLLCAWMVFLPQNLHAAPRIIARLRDWRVLAALAIGFAIYLATWSNLHPYNQENHRHHLRNEALHWLTLDLRIRAAAFVPIAWSALTLLTTPLAERRFLLLHVAGPLFIALHPLIEQRYYLPALFMYNLWRRPMGAPWERAALAYGAVLGLLLLWGIARGRFLL
jgi:alpha-1,2-glucosyltransferase